jgi:hypothetical protein
MLFTAETQRRTRALATAASLASLTLPEIVLLPLCARASGVEKTASRRLAACILYFIDRE